METMSLKFAAVVGDSPFSCSSTYDGFGPAGDWSLQFLDARMFVHGVELQAADGTWTPAAIRDLSPWQGHSAAGAETRRRRRLSMMHVPLAVTARVIVSAEPF